MTYVDDEELPFTLAEIQQAATRWLGEPRARQLVADLADSVPDYIAYRVQRLTELASSSVGDQAPALGGLKVPDALLAFLSTLSTDVSARVEQLMQKQWAQRRSSMSERKWPERRCAPV